MSAHEINAEELVEPSDLAGIHSESDPTRPTGKLGELSGARAEELVRTAFTARLCGCILGKPMEGYGDLARYREVGLKLGEWPLRDYVTEAFMDSLGGGHPSRPYTTRERIAYVAPDDDLNYTILAMTVLEEKGLSFTRDDLRAAWLVNLAPGGTWGPERGFMATASAATLGGVEANVPVGDERMNAWADASNEGLELCGAAIRADAYGYACLGDPARAADLAWRDSGMTHRRTGIYGSMFIAAAIAAAPFARDPLDIFATALRYVPRRSRFFRVVSDCMSMVAEAKDWLAAYERIHSTYARYGFCQIYQECGTLMNTLRFAKDIGNGICMQVSQGLDTDSFGATAGSLLGIWLGPDALSHRWVAPFHNRIHAGLATFHEQDLEAVVTRMGRLARLTCP
jgi:ADP-ribosylglycohydrolase